MSTQREWKPGDVAMVQITAAHGPEIAVSGDRQWFVAGPRLGSQHGWYHDRVQVVRPLVVIDPEDREAVERLLEIEEQGINDPSLRAVGRVERVQAAFREFADPKPPRPDEPMGLGAVVEDASGGRWVRVGVTIGDMHWRSTDPGDSNCYKFRAIDAVKVLSEGVR